MPSQNIRADYDQLNKIAGSLKTESEAIDARVQQMSAQLETLQSGEWQGDAASMFYGEMGDVVMPALNRLVAAFFNVIGITEHAKVTTRRD